MVLCETKQDKRRKWRIAKASEIAVAFRISTMFSPFLMIEEDKKVGSISVALVWIRNLLFQKFMGFLRVENPDESA